MPLALAFLIITMVSAHAQAPAESPMVETAPVIGWGDYAWLLPFVLIFIAGAVWYIMRRRRAGL